MQISVRKDAQHREVQSKTTMMYYYKAIRMAKQIYRQTTKNDLATPSAGKDGEQQEPSLHRWWE